MLTGLYSIYRHKNYLNKKHFKSWHAKIGVSAIVLNATQICLGLPMVVPFIRKYLISFCKSHNIKINRVHAILGVLTVFLASLAQVVAFNSAWFVKVIKINQYFRYLLSMVPLGQFFIILNQVMNRYFENIVNKRTHFYGI